MKLKLYVLYFSLFITVLTAQEEMTRIKSELNVAGQLQKCVFNAAFIKQNENAYNKNNRTQRYNELKQCIDPIEHYDDLDTLHALKQLVLLELNMALFIAQRIYFETREMRVFDQYNEPIIIKNDPDLKKAMWLFVLLWAQARINADSDEYELNNDITRALEMIEYFLADIGFVYNKQAPASGDLINQQILLLFDHLNVVQKTSSASGKRLIDTLSKYNLASIAPEQVIKKHEDTNDSDSEGYASDASDDYSSSDPV